MINNTKNTIAISGFMIFLLFIIVFFDTNKNKKIEELENNNDIIVDELNICKIERRDLNSILDIIKKEQIEKEYKSVSNGQSLYLILNRLGFSPQEIYHTTNEMNKINRSLSTLRVNQQYRIVRGYYGLMYVDIFLDSNRFIRIDKTDDILSVYQSEIEYSTKYKSVYGKINSSLYLDGIKSGLTQRQIEEFSQIFAWDIDFSRNVRKGDEFRVVYEAHYDGDRIIGRGRIVAANIKTGNGDFYAFGYSEGNSPLRYFNKDGESVEKAFLKAPVEAARVTSRFTRSRYHPILKTNRPHRGVDYGGALNTPIMVTADGVITRRRHERAYGNVIIVDHGQGYETLYAHMNKFNDKFKVGSSVNQGDIIGHMGTTGLSTGVHLHYELRVNGRHEDPLSIDLPNGEKVENINNFKESLNYLKSYWD